MIRRPMAIGATSGKEVEVIEEGIVDEPASHKVESGGDHRADDTAVEETIEEDETEKEEETLGAHDGEGWVPEVGNEGGEDDEAVEWGDRDHVEGGEEHVEVGETGEVEAEFAEVVAVVRRQSNGGGRGGS